MHIKGLYSHKDSLDSDTVSTASSEITTNDDANNWSGVFGASSLLFQVSRAIGILPAEAVKNKPSHTTVSKEKEPTQVYKPNGGTRIYSFLLYLAGIGLGCVSIYYRTMAMLMLIESKQEDKNKDVDSVNLYFKLAYTLFTLLFCLIYAIFSRFSSESFGTIFTCLDQVDESFHYSDHTPATKRALYQLLFSALVLPLAVSDCYSMTIEFNLTEGPLYAHVGFAMHFLALVANVIVEQQFIALCLALKERFEFLNLNLISLQPLVFPEYEHADVKFKTNDLNEQLFAIARSEFAGALKYNKQKFNEQGLSSTQRSGLVTPSGPYVRSAWGKETTTTPLNPINTGSIFESPPVSLKARLALLRRVHDSLSDIMGQVNGLYGGCLLASISFIFCGVLSLSYYVVNNALYPKPGGGNSVVISLVQSILWLLYLSARLIALAWACASTTKEAQRAGPLHQKLTRRTLDSSTKEELHLFSTQLLQRDIGFSVCGLFPLDFTLLYTVAGAVTTYLVILIQFQSVQPNTKSSNATSTTMSPFSTTKKSN
ncbi:gustatory receptor for bitter taste 66a-like [Neocloeon triangulifer]|uniref:gustatory receptor for bitter taste 66a-like n=1 Tax=Neocloeon triangulifer TaxID=2078957 RepID=UPI00286F31A1|nr:gustatory receptor for bitter taste 66a-like [Neocloeon triangulifer]